MLKPKKGDLVYLPSDITIFGSIKEGGEIHDWIRLEDPSYGVMVSPNHNRYYGGNVRCLKFQKFI